MFNKGINFLKVLLGLHGRSVLLRCQDGMPSQLFSGSSEVPRYSRSLPHTFTYLFETRRVPMRFHLSCNACIFPGTHYCHCPFRIVAWGFTFPNDIKRRRRLAVCLNIGFDGADFIRWHGVILSQPIQACKHERSLLSLGRFDAMRIWQDTLKKINRRGSKEVQNSFKGQTRRR